jgi:hypothetical protein
MRLSAAVSRWTPDLIYLRYTPLLPPPVWLFRRIPTVIEVNSDDRTEYDSKAGAQQLFNLVSRRLLFRHARGAVAITSELAASCIPSDLPVHHKVITNGVVVDRQTVHVARGHSRPRLVFLHGAPGAWQAVDKVIWLATALPEFDFDVVGCRELSPGTTPRNVTVHSFATPGEYEPILAQADVGIGTLGLHRKSMYEAAPLKVREYLAFGMPVVIGYVDPDLADAPWFVLRLPNSERNVVDHLDDIRSFVWRVAGRRAGYEEVFRRVDSRAKERDRVSYFRDVLGRSAPSR